MTTNRKTLMIPGPIECETNVLQAMGAPPKSHTAPDFIKSFGNCLNMMKKVWMCPSGQPFLVAGTGTLAMEMAAANLIEEDDHALVISTGYFGKRYAEILERHGAKITILEAPVGDVVKTEDIEEELQHRDYKLMTFTHVDTSTAVMVDAASMGALGRKHNVLTVLDGVCSVAGEEIRQEEWGIDVVLTASQKAIGIPPGLALLVASPKAMETWKSRKTRVRSYYADWNNWLPIMDAYTAGKPAYFGTPAVNLVTALETGLNNILQEGLQERFERHKKTGLAFREAIRALGLSMIPKNETVAANTLSAPYLPEDVSLPDFMKAMGEAEVIIAGGLLPEIKGRYIRIGHMGSVAHTDLMNAIRGIARSLNQCGHKTDEDRGVLAIEETMKE
ncbi:MAG: pyridoxal-phosphate-dependent aminotransferase family protein [Bacteroidales bacterium]